MFIHQTSLQDIWQNHWTMKYYRSQKPTFIFRSNIRSYWLIISKYDVHTSNSLQNIRQNHWTLKYRSWWPSLHDPQVNVTKLTEVRPSICLRHNRKLEKHFSKGPRFWPLAPPRAWSDPGVRSHGMKAGTPGYLWSKYECFLISGCRDMNYWNPVTLNYWFFFNYTSPILLFSI